MVGTDRIQVLCTECGAGIRAKHEHAGRTVACPKCNGPVSVPLSQADDSPLRIDSNTSPDVRKPGRGIVHWVLPGLSLIVALAALGMTMFRDPLGSGISKYDFSTPRAALESQMKIDLNNDIRAILEMESRVQGKKRKEKLDTLEVRKEAEFRGKKILFIAFKADGVNKYNTQAFEKDANTGYWLPSYTPAYEVEKDNKELAAEMRKWESSGALGSGK